ncbi:SAP domain-containing ribonucleoprotein-like [Mizuhopecten yessoensis]|uniref:SAP domain-containing ribonucleoprotein n=1 Tax=Mizuhopecten yessoensis TaxID=6573 RepID=A0A210QL44_MIZYE|nr:SAP domain-containing ribonucleoprotein-like [Mizuhopecten yessoensis]OWF49436.1 SAP domain-containing ribonucleoprotein [Mizuhopecten yessoensis]
MANASEDFLAEIAKMKVPDLKKECKSRNLPTTGTKKDLIQRLKAEVSEGSGEDKVEEDVADVADDSVEDALDQVLGEDDTAPKESVTVSKIKEQITAPDSDDKPVSTKAIDENDRLKMRVQKFGAVNPEVKKQLRAERFGTSEVTAKGGDKISPAPAADMDKLKKRAERFGTVTSTVLTKVDETQKLKKRAERFGAITSTSLSNTENQGKLLKRKERFGVTTSAVDASEVDAKKKKRAERFGLT